MSKNCGSRCVDFVYFYEFVQNNNAFEWKKKIVRFKMCHSIQNAFISFVLFNFVSFYFRLYRLPTLSPLSTANPHYFLHLLRNTTAVDSNASFTGKMWIIHMESGILHMSGLYPWCIIMCIWWKKRKCATGKQWQHGTTTGEKTTASLLLYLNPRA